jgi:hypothetical protein
MADPAPQALATPSESATNNGRTPPEENPMFTHTRCSRTAATIAAATATVALFVGASPANAKPAPEPVGQDVSVWTCPTRVDAVAQALRLQGFSAPAAKNFALFTKQDCTDVT